MNRRALLLCLSVVACKNGGSTDGTTYDFECEVGEPYDLADPFAALDGIEHQCESAVYYNPDVPTATSYFVGEFHSDDCGNVLGRETWVLYANPEWISRGGGDCRVVWDVIGSRAEAVNAGDYSISFSAAVNVAETTCLEDLYEAEMTFDQSYDVQVDATGGSTIYWVGGQLDGQVLGRGNGNDNHVTYVSDVNCKLF